MTISIEVRKASKDVLINIPSHLSKHREGLKDALTETGAEVVKETRRLINTGPKTGRIYNFGGRKHQASAPGEAPANRTGTLAKSADFKAGSWHEMTVGESASYAGYLENGTRGRKTKDGGRVGKIAPRPHLIKAVNNKARDAENAITDNVLRRIKR